MLETLNIIHDLTQMGVKIIFIRQPELSTTGPHTQLLLAIYSYFAETEREFISIAAIQKLINEQMDKPLTYNSYKYFIGQDALLQAYLSKEEPLHPTMSKSVFRRMSGTTLPIY